MEAELLGKKKVFVKQSLAKVCPQRALGFMKETLRDETKSMMWKVKGERKGEVEAGIDPETDDAWMWGMLLVMEWPTELLVYPAKEEKLIIPVIFFSGQEPKWAADLFFLRVLIIQEEWRVYMRVGLTSRVKGLLHGEVRLQNNVFCCSVINYKYRC